MMPVACCPLPIAYCLLPPTRCLFAYAHAMPWPMGQAWAHAPLDVLGLPALRLLAPSRGAAAQVVKLLSHRQ